ncbi:MAG: hypothetical protein MHM6MM_001228 [Cercozoa sp. M6MM]
MGYLQAVLFSALLSTICASWVELALTSEQRRELLGLPPTESPRFVSSVGSGETAESSVPPIEWTPSPRWGPRREQLENKGICLVQTLEAQEALSVSIASPVHTAMYRTGGLLSASSCSSPPLGDNGRPRVVAILRPQTSQPGQNTVDVLKVSKPPSGHSAERNFDDASVRGDTLFYTLSEVAQQLTSSQY